MKEIELIKKAIEKIISDKQFGKCFIWRSQSFSRRIRIDIFNCFDLIIYSQYGIIYLVQITTLTNLSARRKKILNYFGLTPPPPHSEIWAWDKNKNEFKIEKL